MVKKRRKVPKGPGRTPSRREFFGRIFRPFGRAARAVKAESTTNKPIRGPKGITRRSAMTRIGIATAIGFGGWKAYQFFKWRNPRGTVYAWFGEHTHELSALQLRKKFESLVRQGVKFDYILLEQAELTQKEVERQNKAYEEILKKAKEFRKEYGSGKMFEQKLNEYLLADSKGIFTRHLLFLSCYYNVPLRVLEVYTPSEVARQRQLYKKYLLKKKEAASSRSLMGALPLTREMWRILFEYVSFRNRGIRQTLQQELVRMSKKHKHKVNVFTVAGSGHFEAFDSLTELDRFSGMNVNKLFQQYLEPGLHFQKEFQRILVQKNALLADREVMARSTVHDLITATVAGPDLKPMTFEGAKDPTVLANLARLKWEDFVRLDRHVSGLPNIERIKQTIQFLHEMK